MKNTHSLRGHQGPVLCVKFNTNGEYCVSGGQDRLLRLWNPRKDRLLQTYSGHSGDVTDCDVQKDNGALVSVGGDRFMYIWDVIEARPKRKIRVHEQRVLAVRYNEVNSVVMTGGLDRKLKFWDLRSRSTNPIQEYGEFMDGVVCIDCMDCTVIASDIDGQVCQFDLRRGRVSSDQFANSITGVHMKSTVYAAACMDGTVHLLDRETGEQLQSFRGHSHTDFPIRCAMTSAEDRVFCGSECGRLYAWDVVSGRLVPGAPFNTEENRRAPIAAVATHPTESTTVVTGGHDSVVRMWEYVADS